MDYENLAMMLIVNSGNAKSLAMEAMRKAREGDFDQSEKKMMESEEALSVAHKQHTDTLQDSIENAEEKVNMLMAHAQDHLMNAVTTIDIAKEFCALCELIYKSSKANRE